eukprot:6261750-Amphidinium_carterae.1
MVRFSTPCQLSERDPSTSQGRNEHTHMQLTVSSSQSAPCGLDRAKTKTNALRFDLPQQGEKGCCLSLWCSANPTTMLGKYGRRLEDLNNANAQAKVILSTLLRTSLEQEENMYTCDPCALSNAC